MTNCCVIEVNDTQRRMRALYIYSVPVSGANGCMQKHRTISYKQLTRQLTKNRGGLNAVLPNEFRSV